MSRAVTQSESRIEQGAIALLLLLGLYFPTSTDGEHNVPVVITGYLILILLLVYLALKTGFGKGAVPLVSLPIVVVLVAFTLAAVLRGPFDLDPSLFVRFSVLALLLGLNLKTFHPGPLVNAAFLVANILNILLGIGVLIGFDRVTSFLPKYYWTSDSNLVPFMMSLHKPVLSFGSHALAGLFTYLFFWLNWESYRVRGSRISLIFALSYLFLLLGLMSFTALAFAALALAQLGVWYAKHNPRMITVAGLCVVLIVVFAAHVFADEIEIIRNLPQIADVTFLNSDFSGPIARYGPGGSLGPAMAYLFQHPFQPIGLARSASGFDVASPSHFFVGDSGPMEYLLRGSIPLLFFIYFGLYRFLRNNLISTSHAVLLFGVFIVFEVGYSALSSIRTFFLLPVFVIYLNYLASGRSANSFGNTLHQSLPS